MAEWVLGRPLLGPGKRILRRALGRCCRLYGALCLLLGLLGESALRRAVVALAYRACPQSLAFFFDSLACTEDPLFPCIRLVLLVHGSFSFSG